MIGSIYRQNRCAAVLALLVLGACQAPGDAIDTAREPEQPARAAAPTADSESSATTAEDITSPDNGDAPSIALQPVPPIDDNPEHFLGLDTAAVEGRLGSPDLLRREPPAEVWQYQGKTCVLDLFLYDKDGSKQVVYLEARDLEAAETESRACLRTLLMARRDGLSS